MPFLEKKLKKNNKIHRITIPEISILNKLFRVCSKEYFLCKNVGKSG
jgi:hypothetical protein